MFNILVAEDDQELRDVYKRQSSRRLVQVIKLPSIKLIR